MTTSRSKAAATAPPELIPERLPPPGPSFLREHAVRIGDRSFVAGMTRPSDADGWWIAILWVADDEGVPAFTELAPASGPPPDPPAGRLGNAMAGSLSGMILEDDGHLQVRLGPLVAPPDPQRPWRTPAIVRAGFRWEPARAATLRPNELADEVLTAFRRAVEGLHRP
jgi:hypothetical protein